ncbi:SDR family oxidoreductase [Sphingobium fuliginis]|uniref:SDR family oxidoreductase n=1 Tax=Sphingobium fuliginis (strain ATCC 27551) TaxID=336203 RepID=UPI00350E50F3
MRMVPIRVSIPMSRMGPSEEVAQAARWSLADALSYISGTVLSVDGGYPIV